MAALALVLLLAGPAVAGAASQKGPVARGNAISAGVAGFWAWIKAALPFGAVAQMSCDKGLVIDPNGCPAAAAVSGPPAGSTATTNGDAGLAIDPNGG
jgi:hypothetical protein